MENEDFYNGLYTEENNENKMENNKAPIKKIIIIAIAVIALLGIGLLVYFLFIKKGEPEKPIVINDFSNSSFSCYVGDVIVVAANISEDNLKSYVSENDKVVAIMKDELTLKSSCVGEGSTKLKIENNSGEIREATISVSKKIEEVDVVSFSPNNLSCKVGETITTEVKPSLASSAISNYKSNDNSIVSVSKSSGSASCNNCTKLDIKCLKAGTTKVDAMSTSGVMGSVTVKVNANSSTPPANDTGKISFDKSSYSCKEGDLVDVVLKTNNAKRIKSYSSSNNSIATLKEHPTRAMDCVDCMILQLKCLKAGSATLSAVSETNAKGSAKVTVTKAASNDTTPPTATFSPKSQEFKIGKTAIVNVKVSDPSGIESMRCLVIRNDNGNVETIIDTKYVNQDSYTLDLTNFIKKEGNYFVRVTAKDKAGNETKAWIDSEVYRFVK